MLYFVTSKYFLKNNNILKNLKDKFNNETLKFIDFNVGKAIMTKNSEINKALEYKIDL